MISSSSSLLAETRESSLPRAELRESPKHRRRRGRSRGDAVPVQRLAERSFSNMNESSVLVDLILSRMVPRDSDLSTVLLSLLNVPPRVVVNVVMTSRRSAERVRSVGRLMLDRSRDDALAEVRGEVGRVGERRMLMELVGRSRGGCSPRKRVGEVETRSSRRRSRSRSRIRSSSSSADVEEKAEPEGWSESR